MLERIRGKVKVQARYIFISMSDTRYEARDDDYLLIIIGTKTNGLGNAECRKWKTKKDFIRFSGNEMQCKKAI